MKIEEHVYFLKIGNKYFKNRNDRISIRGTHKMGKSGDVYTSFNIKKHVLYKSNIP
jgi:hypothetical protein